MSIFTASPTENLNVLPEKTARRTRESTENKAITANLPGELSRGAFAVVGHPTLAEIYEYNYHAVNVIIALA